MLSYYEYMLRLINSVCLFIISLCSRTSAFDVAKCGVQKYVRLQFSFEVNVDRCICNQVHGRHGVVQ